MENNNQQPTFTTGGQAQAIPPQPVPEPKPKMKLWKKILITLVIVVVVIGLGLYELPLILTLLHPGDAVLVDNSQLLLQQVSVPQQDNGFYDLNGITADMLTLPANDPNFQFEYTNYNTTTPVQWNQQLVDQVLQANQQALAAFGQAASKNNFQVPDYSDPTNLDANIKLYPMDQWLEAGRLQAIKALSLSYQGNPDQALQEAINLNKVGHEIIIGHNSLIGALVGISFEKLGSETILQILPYGKPSDQALQAVSQAVKNSSDDSVGYKDIYQFEYTKDINILSGINQQLNSGIQNFVQQNQVDPSYANYVKYGYYYKPNRTKNLFTNLFNIEIADVGVQCGSNALVQQLTQNKIVPAKLIFQENAVGQMLYSIMGIDLDAILKTECQNDLAANVAQTELALRQYKTDSGSLPSSLDVLMPQYLTSVPLDPFDHQPIRYSAAKKIIYSVGLNKQDLGGSMGADWMQMDNPTFQIGF